MRSRDAIRRKRRRERERHYNGKVVRVESYRVVSIPADVERVETVVPCTWCGQARGPCRHRVYA